MPTVDFVSPAGAFTPAGVGDAQDLTTTWTISSGSPNLTCNGASPFVSGDTGKAFNLTGAGASGGVLSGTLTFVSSTQVTLSVNAGTALSATSARLVWGTDNAPAVQAFNTWAQSQVSPITLTLGAGAQTFFFRAADANQKRGNSFAWGVSQALTVSGNGPSNTIFIGGLPGGCGLGAQFNMQSGNGAYSNSSIWTAKLQTVQAGSSQVTCITTADAMLFSNNTYAMISGIDLQGSGTPPNPYYFEYVKITNVNTSTGVITLSAPLANTYKSTWPVFNGGTPGLHPDEGGPATLYVFDQAWVINVTYSGLATDNGLTGGRTQCEAYQCAFTNYNCLDSIGWAPSINGSISFTGCNLGNIETEVDKLVYSLTLDSTICKLKFQSSINQVIIQNGCTVAGLNGTPLNLSISNSTITNTGWGATSYGVNSILTISNVTFSGTYGYSPVHDSGDKTGNFQNDYPLSGGTITFTKSGSESIRWGVPGTLCFFNLPTLGSGAEPGFSYGPTFTITDVIDGGSTVSMPTSMNGGYPSFGGTGPTGIIVPAYPSITATNTTGVAGAVNASAMTSAGYGGQRVLTYATTSFNGATMGVNGTGLQAAMSDIIAGKVVSIVINVTTPYTGTNTPFTWTFLPGNYWGIDLTNVNGSRVAWAGASFKINMRTAGTRTITPSGVTGSVSGDAGLALPVSSFWIGENWGTQMNGSADIRSEYNANPSIGPVFTLTVITNQDPFSTSTTSIAGLGGIFAIQNQSNMVIRGRTR